MPLSCGRYRRPPPCLTCPAAQEALFWSPGSFILDPLAVPCSLRRDLFASLSQSRPSNSKFCCEFHSCRLACVKCHLLMVGISIPWFVTIAEGGRGRSGSERLSGITLENNKHALCILMECYSVFVIKFVVFMLLVVQDLASCCSSLVKMWCSLCDHEILVCNDCLQCRL